MFHSYYIYFFLNYQDAKEHIFALSNKLGPSLKGIDVWSC